MIFAISIKLVKFYNVTKLITIKNLFMKQNYNFQEHFQISFIISAYSSLPNKSSCIINGINVYFEHRYTYWYSTRLSTVGIIVVIIKTAIFWELKTYYVWNYIIRVVITFLFYNNKQTNKQASNTMLRLTTFHKNGGWWLQLLSLVKQSSLYCIFVTLYEKYTYVL